MKVVIAEKPSVAREIASVLGATDKMEGYLEGNGYQVTWAFGHLIGLAEAKAYGWTTWAMENLPMIPERFQIAPLQRDGVSKQLGIIANLSVYLCLSSGHKRGAYPVRPSVDFFTD